MGYITTLFLSVAVNFCAGQQIDGTPYREFIKNSQAGYRNEPTWTTEVRRGQSKVCKNPTW